ncbi:MAG: glycosyltransferase family 39 protein [Xanthobacteraceae bacterium]|nr:glycosyltransferase family 39 protein [Xanthobacteraceae bacterium]
MTKASLLDRLVAPAERLLAALSDPARRERTVVVALVAYVVVWTLYGVLAKAGQDLHVDMPEMLVWSRELALGYPKHPPLAAWLVAAWFAVFPVADWSFYLLAMTVAGVALWIVWRLAGDHLDGEKRALALVLMTFVPFFNFHALKFNANTILLPLWAATTLCFLRSYERRSVLWAALAGVFAAASMLGKYWSVFLLLGLGIAALLDSRRAAYFKSAAPWVTIVVGAVLIAPHLAWHANAEFSPLNYATIVRSGAGGHPLKGAGGYLAVGLAYAALAIALALTAIKPNRAVAADMLWPAAPERRFMTMAFWLPLLLPAVLAPIVGIEITSLWTMSAWALLPVVLLSSPLIALDRRPATAVLAAAVVFPVVMVAVAPFIAGAIHRGGGMPAAMHSRLLAQRVAHEWRRVTDKPLQMVAGESDLAYGVAAYLPGRPSAFPEFNRRLAPWADAARLKRDGVAIVCQATEPTCSMPAAALGLTGPRTEVEVTRTYFGTPGRTGRYTIIIVPPQP